MLFLESGLKFKIGGRENNQGKSVKNPYIDFKKILSHCLFA